MILPDSFFSLQQVKQCMEIFEQVGLDGYFKLEPWGIDFHRAYKLMTSINEDAVVMLTNKEGERVQVQILEALISEALNLPTASQAIKLLHS